MPEGFSPGSLPESAMIQTEEGSETPGAIENAFYLQIRNPLKKETKTD
jgi:hypothetical protein